MTKRTASVALAVLSMMLASLPVTAGPDPPLLATARSCSPTPYACNLGEQPANLGASSCRAADSRLFDLNSFSVRAGEVVTATMHAHNFDGYLALVNPKGQIVRTSNAEPNRPAFVAYEAHEGGIYDLIVSTAAGGDPGAHYRLSLGCLPVTEPDYSPCDGDLCLGNGRFRVDGWWQTSSGQSDKAGGEAITADAGYLWFFAESMPEVMVKVLDACQINGHIWIFAGGLTNVHTALRVVDTDTDREAWVYSPHEHPFRSAQLTAAIPCD